MPITYPYNGNPLFPRYNPLNRCHLYISDAQLALHSTNTLRAIKRDQFLFTKPPTMSDITQNNLGNCYFLSALTSILNHPQGSDYIANMVAVIQTDLQRKIGVRLYVYNNYTNKHEAFYIYFDPTIFVDYKNGRAFRFDLSKHWVHYLQKAYYIFEKFLYPQVTKLKINPDVYQQFQSAVYGGYSSEIFTLLLGRASEEIVLKTPYSREDLYMPLPPDCGLADYSVEQNELFAAIKTKLKSQHFICTDSKMQQAGPADHYKGHKGIVPNHAYSIIGYREGNVLLPDHKTRTLKFIILKNPWGIYIRRYAWRLKLAEDIFSPSPNFILEASSDHELPYASCPYFGNLHFTRVFSEQVPLKSSDAQTGIFAIELSDFFDCFNKINLCSGEHLKKP